MNCSNELPSSYTVNYCPNCGHPIKEENRNDKYTSDGKRVIRDRQTTSSNTTESPSKVFNIGHPKDSSNHVAEKKKEETSTASAIFFVVLIIFFVAVFAYWLWQRYVMEEMFDKGCLATSYDVWGFVDKWDCS